MTGQHPPPSAWWAVPARPRRTSTDADCEPSPGAPPLGLEDRPFHPSPGGRALDFQFDETADRRRLKLLNIVDEHTREALAVRVGPILRRRHCGLANRAPRRRAGSARAAAHGQWPRAPGLGAAELVPPGRHDHDLHRARLAPWENPFIESFNGRVRDDLLNTEEFASLLEAQILAEAWRIEYNTYRPHSSLAGITPAEYAERWTINQPALP